MDQEIKKILADHLLWLKTEGKDGTRAVLADVDLTGQSFEEAHLEYADLKRTNLSYCRFTKAHLYGADCEGADFSCASLNWTNFQRANLKSSYLSFAHLGLSNLSGADLTGAELNFAAFLGVSLRSACLKNVGLASTVFSRTDLRDADFSGAAFADTAIVASAMEGALGLTDLGLARSGFVDIDTLRLSPDLPEAFLVQLGYQGQEPGYMFSLAKSRSPIKFDSCFISHSSNDEKFAQWLLEELEKKGVETFLAPRDLLGGDKTKDQIDCAIRLYDRVIIVLSEDSMNSHWVKTEILAGWSKGEKESRKVLFPVRIVPFGKIRNWEWFDSDEGKDMAKEIREYHIPSFCDWVVSGDECGEEIEKLLTSLQKGMTVL